MVNKDLAISGIVEFNNNIAVVLNEDIKYTYRKLDSKTIIGTCGMFFIAYFYDYVSTAKAFAGRKFTLTMEDGEVVHCNGQWWVGFNSKSRAYIGNRNLTNISYQSLDALKDCYVFYGGYAFEDELSDLLLHYTGKVYKYYEFQDVVIKPIVREEVRIKTAELYDKIITSGFRDLGSWKFDNNLYRITLIDSLRITMPSEKVKEFKASTAYKDICDIFGMEIDDIFYSVEDVFYIHVKIHYKSTKCFKLKVK